MILWIATILWCLYASLEGYIEARHFYYRVSSTRQDKHDEHTTFAIQRGIVLLSFTYVTGNWWNGLCFAAIFMLWHDGIYYFKYNKLAGNYPKGFWDMSTTSTSWWDRQGLTNPVFRITYFVAGLMGLIIINYANY